MTTKYYHIANTGSVLTLESKLAYANPCARDAMWREYIPEVELLVAVLSDLALDTELKDLDDLPGKSKYSVSVDERAPLVVQKTRLTLKLLIIQ